jgi:Zn-dependent protease
LVELTPERIASGITLYVVLLFSLSFHESAHAWAALRLGDDTAQREDRISLNPLVHIDPVGTVMMPLLQFLFSGAPLFAWAKPTPYDPSKFRRDVPMGRGHILVAGAGPLSNLLLALLFTAAIFVTARAGILERGPVLEILASGVFINVLLAMFNLVPIPPLDGSKVASFGLPRSLADRYDRAVEFLGPWLLLLLLIPISRVLGPLNWFLSNLLITAAVLR